MNGIIKKRLEAIEKNLPPRHKTVTVELADGTQAKIDAAEWWKHRHEWKLSDFKSQENRGGLVVCLMFADMADDGIARAKDKAEADRLTEERDQWLKMYFGRAKV